MIFVIILLPFAMLYIGLRFFQKQTFRILGTIANPFVCLYIKQRIKNGLELKDRVKERFGIPSKQRPNGDLVWFHAVSVGETNSLIPFIKEFHEINPNVKILLTTTTVTASNIVSQRLEDIVIHQFIPFDIYMWIRRFIKYWKPKACFLVESEIWPNTLNYLYEKDIPVYLLNTRISNKTIHRMFILKKYFNILPFKPFTQVFVPSDSMKKIVVDLGARDTWVLPNIKIISPKLSVDKNSQKILKKTISERKCWMAVSTHPNEEEIIINVHKKLKDAIPEILTIIAIRHPNRADEVKGLCEKSGLSVETYTKNLDNHKIKSDIYIVDKIGCLGDFFSEVDTVLVCGSLVPGIGGHNFIEPINFSCNTATGQYIENFADIYPYFKVSCKKLADEDEITEFVKDSINSYKKQQRNEEIQKYSEKWTNVISRISKSLFDN